MLNQKIQVVIQQVNLAFDSCSEEAELCNVIAFAKSVNIVLFSEGVKPELINQWMISLMNLWSARVIHKQKKIIHNIFLQKVGIESQILGLPSPDL